MMPRHQADDEAWDGYTRHSYHYDRKARRRAGIRAFMELMVMGWLIRYRRK